MVVVAFCIASSGNPREQPSPLYRRVHAPEVTPIGTSSVQFSCATNAALGEKNLNPWAL